jgi:hypothetical protein
MSQTTHIPTDSVLELHPHNLLNADQIDAGTTILCEEGILWLTQSNDMKDYMLEAGDSVTVDHGHKILIEAISEARVSVIHHN